MKAIEVRTRGLSKRFGSVDAVQDATFALRPGAVTGFLGPNGAGKTTTLRMMLGLVAPDAGSAVFDGTDYRRLDQPSAVVGAVLDSVGAHPATTAREHLRTYAALGGHPRFRVDQLIGTLEMGSFADRRIRGYSTGMRQRVSLATALLGDPSVLILDEPANGLDPAGIAWLRTFLRSLADEGRTVLIASHVLSEIEQTVDDVVLIHHGRIITAGSLTQVMGQRSLEQAFLDFTTAGAT